jgi:hypothetical protein
MYTAEVILFELRILTATIAVIMALYHVKFFDNIFKLILENTLSYELSLPVKMSSLRLTLYFPDENEIEDRNGGDFFLENKKEKERKIIDGNVTVRIEASEIENAANSVTSRTKSEGRSSISGNFDKFFGGLFAPAKIRNSKSFMGVEKVELESVSKRNGSKSKHNHAQMQRDFTMRKFLEDSRTFLKSYFNYSLPWNFLLFIFVRLYSVRGKVILTNVLVLSPLKELDPRWTNESIVEAEKIKVTFNFFRALYYFLFSFTKFIVFDNVFVDGLTINVEGYEEKNGIQSHYSKEKENQTVGNTDNNHLSITESSTEPVSATDKLNNLYSNLMSSINVKSEVIYNVSLFGKTIPTPSSSSSSSSPLYKNSPSRTTSNSTSFLISSPKTCSSDTTGSKTKEQLIPTSEKHGNCPSSSSSFRGNSLNVKGDTDLIHGKPLNRTTWIESPSNKSKSKSDSSNSNSKINSNNNNSGNDNLDNNSAIKNQESRHEKEIHTDKLKENYTLKEKEKEKEKDASLSFVDCRKAPSKDETKPYDLFTLFDQAKEQFNNDVRTSPPNNMLLCAANCE